MSYFARLGGRAGGGGTALAPAGRLSSPYARVDQRLSVLAQWGALSGAHTSLVAGPRAGGVEVQSPQSGVEMAQTAAVSPTAAPAARVEMGPASLPLDTQQVAPAHIALPPVATPISPPRAQTLLEESPPVVQAQSTLESRPVEPAPRMATPVLSRMPAVRELALPQPPVVPALEAHLRAPKQVEQEPARRALTAEAEPQASLRERRVRFHSEPRPEAAPPAASPLPSAPSEPHAPSPNAEQAATNARYQRALADALGQVNAWMRAPVRQRADPSPQVSESPRALPAPSARQTRRSELAPVAAAATREVPAPPRLTIGSLEVRVVPPPAAPVVVQTVARNARPAASAAPAASGRSVPSYLTFGLRQR